MTYDLTYISLGLGRQSKSMFAMSALGRHGVPKADCAIFADTGDEIEDTYRELEWAERFGKVHGIPVYTVDVGTTLAAAAAAALSGRKRGNGAKFFVSLPLYVVNDDGSHGMIRRQCTNEFKLVPIRLKVRELLGLKKGEPAKGKLARALIGISLDEVIRMKPSPDAYIHNAYPLIDARLNVQNCVTFLRENGFSIPVKSACRMCPYHDDAYWRWLKTARPEEFEKACAFDDLIRDLKKAGLTQAAYVHRSCRPLREIDFSSEEDRGQLNLAGGFGAECEGMCGT